VLAIVSGKREGNSLGSRALVVLVWLARTLDIRGGGVLRYMGPEIPSLRIT